MKKPINVKEGAEYFYHAAIFNQIFTSTYYHVSRYKLNSRTGKYALGQKVTQLMAAIRLDK